MMSNPRFVGVLMTAQDAAAHAPNHWAMPAHENGEGGFVPLGDEILQQLTIAQVRFIPWMQRPTKALEELAHGTGRHVNPSTWPRHDHPLRNTSRSGMVWYAFFMLRGRTGTILTVGAVNRSKKEE